MAYRHDMLGTRGLHNMHQFDGVKVRFQRLMFPLAMWRHLLLGLMILIILLHILLPLGDEFHLVTYNSLHPPAGTSRCQRYLSHGWYLRHLLLLILLMLIRQCHHILLMMMSQCHLRMVRLLSHGHLEEAL